MSPSRVAAAHRAMRPQGDAVPCHQRAAPERLLHVEQAEVVLAALAQHHLLRLDLGLRVEPVELLVDLALEVAREGWRARPCPRCARPRGSPARCSRGSCRPPVPASASTTWGSSSASMGSKAAQAAEAKSACSGLGSAPSPSRSARRCRAAAVATGSWPGAGGGALSCHSLSRVQTASAPPSPARPAPRRGAAAAGLQSRHHRIAPEPARAGHRARDGGGLVCAREVRRGQRGEEGFSRLEQSRRLIFDGRGQRQVERPREPPHRRHGLARRMHEGEELQHVQRRERVQAQPAGGGLGMADVGRAAVSGQAFGSLVVGEPRERAVLVQPGRMTRRHREHGRTRQQRRWRGRGGRLEGGRHRARV